MWYLLIHVPIYSNYKFIKRTDVIENQLQNDIGHFYIDHLDN